MKNINPILQHTIAEGHRTGENFIIEVNAEHGTLRTARTICGDDTFIKVDCSRVIGAPAKFRTAIVVDESVEERRVSFRVIDPNWEEEREGTKLRTALHLKGTDEVEARIEFNRGPGNLTLHLIKEGKVIETEAGSRLSLSRLIGVAENFVHTWMKDDDAKCPDHIIALAA